LGNDKRFPELDVSIYETDGNTPFDLLKALKKHGHLYIDVCIGAKENLHEKCGSSAFNRGVRKLVCTNPDCKARGLIGEDNIGIHSHKEKRYICRGTVLTLDTGGEVKQWALCRPLLLVFDGFAVYVHAFRTVFCTPLPTGTCGRRPLIS